MQQQDTTQSERLCRVPSQVGYTCRTMAWGQRGGKGVEDLVQRLQCSDPNLTSLNIFPTRKFGHQVCTTLSAGCNATIVMVTVLTSAGNR